MEARTVSRRSIVLVAMLLACAAGTAPAGGPGRFSHEQGCCDDMGCEPCAARGCGPACRQPCCPDRCGPRCFDGHGHHCLKHDTIEKRYFLRSQGKSWHSAWYDPSVGRPMALVVPPTAEFMTEYSWGVPSSRVAPLYHQFRRPYPGAGAVPGSGGSFMPTPNQPSDTVQFGVHAVRGPWGAY
ncbi:MAG: hypothetical protein ACKOYJ_08005 [Planctomycetia bacterium]